MTRTMMAARKTTAGLKQLASKTAWRRQSAPLFQPQSDALRTAPVLPNFDLTSPIITVVVGIGAKLQIFLVHEGVITPRSKYIKRALNKHWQVGEDRTVPLTEEDTYTFGLYLEVFYRGYLALEAAAETEYDKTTVDQNYLIVNKNLQGGLAMVLACKDDGSKLKHHIVDKVLLCSRSGFFANALKWKKDQTGKDDTGKPITIRVLLDSPKLFGMYQKCLTDDFPLEPTAFMPPTAGDNKNENANEASEVREPTEEDKADVRAEYERIRTLYILVKYLIDYRLMNRLIRATVQAAHATRGNGKTWLPNNEYISEIYDGTTKGGKMRELLVELHVDFADRTWLMDRDRDLLPKDYIFDCLQGVAAKRHRDALAQSESKTYDYRNFQYKPEETKSSQRG